MRKVLSWILVLAVCFGMLSTAAIAAGSDTVDFAVNSVQLCPDAESVTVVVEITNNPGFSNATFEVNYDSACLSLTNVLMDSQEHAFYGNRFAFADSGDTFKTGTFVELVFDVVAPGETSVSIAVWEDDFYNEAGDVLNANVTAGMVTIGHIAGDTVIENEVAADCDNDGSYDKVVYCEVCGEELSRETVTDVAPGHTEGNVVIENEVAADCVNDGSYDEVVYCEVCGEELSRKTTTIPALGHTEGEAVIENETGAVCEDAGSFDKVVYCTVCGEEVSRETITVVAPGHTEGEVVIENEIPATCTTPGSYEEVIYCKVCGEELSRETKEIAAAGDHVYGDLVIENEIFDVHGDRIAYDEVYYCAECGEELYRKTIEVPAGEHNWRDIVIAPSCDEWGCTLHICVDGDCTASYTSNYVPALGHTFGEYVSNNDATCTEDGTKTAKCVRCDATDTIADEGSAKGHGSFSVKFNSWPTCTEDADWDVYCEACGIQIADEEWQSWGTINGWKATGHKWADATCTTPKTCTVCGETEGEMLAHTEEIIPGKAATCTEAGLTEGKKCSVCGEILVAQEEIAVLEHTEEIIPGKAATCTETGLTEGKKCSVCGEILVAQEEIAVLEHAGEWVIVKEAQIGEAGLKQLICTVCGEVIAEEEIPALEEPAPTSDSMILLFVISAMAAMTGAAVLVMKKKYF